MPFDPNGDNTAFFKFIKKCRAERKAAALTQLEEDYSELDPILTKAYKLFNASETDQWFHLMVGLEHRDHWVTIWILYGGEVLEDLACDCETAEGKPHCHMIAWKPKAFKTNTFNRAFNKKYNRKVHPFMSDEKARIARGGNRKYYLKPMKSGVHFIHTILYICTSNTNGFHSGELQKCRHYNQTLVTFPTKAKMIKWRKNVFAANHPDIEAAMEKEWLECETRRQIQIKKRVVQGLSGAVFQNKPLNPSILDDVEELITGQSQDVWTSPAMEFENTDEFDFDK